MRYAKEASVPIVVGVPVVLLTMLGVIRRISLRREQMEFLGGRRGIRGFTSAAFCRSAPRFGHRSS
jgi:hypothetical protein